VAFGDSITAGVLATSCPAGGGVSCAIPTLTALLTQAHDDLRLLYPGIGEESSSAYPRQLQSMLASRFSAQSISIVNEGSPGEFLVEGKARLPATLTKDAPQVLMLQEGANDLNQARPPIATLVNDLRAMVREARSRGVEVFIGTTLPQRPRACRGYDFCDGVADTVPLNAQIRAMAASEGAVLVDLYPLFDGQTATLLGLDGLHPNQAGYQKMAEAFFAAIAQRLEK
jgi:lysophospholipase L1-like esterase